MRLTLRTLLAHLDRTLEADDDAAIAAKLRESEFAATLVNRISRCIASEQLNAPSPVSTSTVDDPNRIGEYLDSVLSSEQVAEIERICLESDIHLAEVAACHQILTIVLGNPAEVPPSLRTRIYDIGQGETPSSSHNLLSNGIPTGTVRRVPSPAGVPTGGDAITQALAAESIAPSNATARASSVAPVGPDDSGVSDAPTRLRSFPGAKSSPATQPAMAGSRSLNASEASEIFGRPSRVVPWLVGLALAASFLFFVALAFRPLLRGDRVVDKDSINADDNTITPETASLNDAPEPNTALVEADAINTPPMIDLDPRAPESDTEDDTLLPPANESISSDAVDPKPIEPLSPPPAPTGQDVAMDELPAPEELLPPASEETKPVEDSPLEEDAPPTGDAPSTDETMANDVPMESSESEPVPGAPATDKSVGTIASVVSDSALLLVQKPADASFMLTKKDASIAAASNLICPPLYRNRLSVLDQIDMTMAGPARVQLSATTDGVAQINLGSGRLLLTPWVKPTLSPTDNDSQIGSEESSETIAQIVFGELTHELTFAQPDSMVALEVEFARSPGSDPEDAGSAAEFLKVLAVKGSFDWKTSGLPLVTVATGEELRWAANDAATKTPSASIPAWIEPPKPVPGAIEASARDGLLSLVRENESIELSLREAIHFRRAEVGALAAQTLILLESPDCYFGADGIFGDVKQKAFWPDHFAALVSKMDQGAESATVVREAINQMDAAEADVIFRLLWLFSNSQLEAGADATLVESLDSSNMTVRVLAAENLRRITGTTLYFKPENNTAPRRASDIKKWETRLKKRDIRWPEPGVAPDAIPVSPVKAPAIKAAPPSADNVPPDPTPKP